jgi:GNAT superfamily N-acetyltransferase
MTAGDRPDAHALLLDLLENDPYYRDSREAYGGARARSGDIESALAQALSLFLDRPDYGYVWMAFEDDRAVGCALVGYAISPALGEVIANVEGLVVAPQERRRGIGSAMLEALAEQLKGAEIARIDMSVNVRNGAAREFCAALGFEPTYEERFALLL